MKANLHSPASYVPTAQTESYLAQYKWLSPGFAYEHHPVTFIFISCDDTELQDTVVIDLPEKKKCNLRTKNSNKCSETSLFL